VIAARNDSSRSSAIQEPPVLVGEAILPRARRERDHLLFKRGGLGARLGRGSPGFLDHPLRWLNALDLVRG